MDEQVSKRPRIEVDDVPGVRIAARSVIQLRFVDPFFAAAQTAKPLFTHQLFDDEEIVIDKQLFNQESEVIVFVQSDSMEMAVFIAPNLVSTLETEKQESLISYFTQRLSLSIPNGIPIIVISHVQPEFVPERPVFPLIGTAIHSFTKTTPSEEFHYQINLATHHDNHACDLLSRLEKLAIWFIETASSVDFKDDRWEVLFLYQLDPVTHKQTIAGYLTLYTFHNPVLGSRIRICQALILPHRQKQGLGRELLHTAYRLAHSRAHVTEITVEDPCPGFQALRDQVDFELVVAHFKPSQEATELPAEEVICKELKITKGQGIFIVECWKFIQFLQSEPPPSPTVVVACTISYNQLLKDPVQREQLLDYLDDSKSFKTFRLQVKRGIVNRDKELMAMSKEDRLEELEELFDERLKRYLAVLPLAEKMGMLIYIANSNRE